MTRASACALAATVGLLAGVAGCRRPTMTPEACAEYVDHLVDVTLRSRGFADPELARRWKVELRETLAAELTACATLPRDEELLSCVGGAADDGALWRDCLAHTHRPRPHEHEP